MKQQSQNRNADFENLYRMTPEEAEPYARKDCSYCQANMALACEKGYNVLVDKESMDVVGVQVNPEGGSR